ETAEDIYDLSLEELMNITIVSASKKEESVFDAPVSSNSITRDDIIRSGATSIPEALRLSPDLIVREQANGNFDVHIRGFDNIARYSASFDRINKITLVMIDDRPVFNYNYGGTFWESLPIDLIDIERIEVVRGPSAPLFGPNAVAGVINIITNKPDSEEVQVRGNLQYGSQNSFIGNLSLGRKLSDSFAFRISTNYQFRERHDDQYYNYGPDVFTDISAAGLVSGAEDPQESMNKYGINGFFYLKPAEDIDVAVSLGYQDARVQQTFLTPTAPTFNNGNSYYGNINASIKNFGFRLSGTSGFDELAEVQGLGLSTEYDYRVVNASLDYTWEVVKDKLEIVPSINVQDIKYDDTEYITSEVSGLYNKEVELSVLGGGLKADFRPVESLRFIGALRLDKYNIPDDSYLSYQLMGTYKANDNVLFRAVHAKSNSGSFNANSFTNADITLPPSGPGLPPTIVQFRGDENLDLANNVMTEIGVRWQAKNNLQIDFSLFNQTLSDISQSNIQAPAFDPMLGAVIVNNLYQNLEVEAKQVGTTISVNWLPSDKWQVRPYITLQKTDLENLREGTDIIDTEHGSTPNYFGGAFINFRPTKKLNINLNPYFLASYELYHEEDLERVSQQGLIEKNMIINAKISYEVVEGLQVYFNGRNIGGNSREFYGTDKMTGLYLGGVSYNF
ncbi:MAG: TonB-dependent receptor plug domain-containing protein, partial [Bacteroidota bacterium]